MKSLKNSFKFLTAEDLKVLQDKMVIKKKKAESIIIKEGEQKLALFVLLEGLLRVEKDYLGTPVPFSSIQEGEMFGEMSLIEHRGASGSVVCDTDCKIAVLEEAEIQYLKKTLPGFDARFYQSLAYILSVRLRQNDENLIPGILSGG